MTIPACVHFCWIGPRLPWAYVFAVLSAAERSEMQDIVLHHTDSLEAGPELRALQADPRVKLSRIDPVSCLTQAASMLGLGDQLTERYRRIPSPVMRSDILRVAILYLQGGIYLDLDTITFASLRPLLSARQFVGAEFIVWPHFVLKSRSPLLWARVLSLDMLRKFMRLLPQGWRLFRRIETCYFPAANNAIMGAEPGAPLMAEYLRSIVELPASRLTQPYALGPDLLQELVERFPKGELTIRPPRVFFPLGPEISEHWFRHCKTPRLDAVLFPETLVVHWYASVRGKSRVARITPEYVAAHRNDQLYAALVAAALPRLSAG